MISIIIPFDRGEHFLADCLESLKRQTFKDFEVVLVTPPSCEGAEAVIEKYHSSIEIRQIKSGKEGVGCFRNLGISEAVGEYVYFLDADDYLYDDSLEKLIGELESSDLDFVFGTKYTTYFRYKAYFTLEHPYEDKEMAVRDKKDKKYKPLYYRPRFLEDVKPESLSKKQLNEYHKDAVLGRLVALRDGLGTISALHVMIKKDRAIKWALAFDEEVTLYSDLLFVVSLLSSGAKGHYVRDSYYVKRLHNDPEHYPSIKQLEAEDRFDQMLKAYDNAMKKANEESMLAAALADHLVNYYVYTFNHKLFKNRNDEEMKRRFELLKAEAGRLPEKYYKHLKGYKKRSVNVLREGTVSKACHFVFWFLGKRKFQSFLKNPKVLGTFLYFNLFTKLPMRNNYVFLESFRGKAYSDSPKYIYEYLAKNYPGKYKYIWVFDSIAGKTLPYGGVKVKRFGIKYMYYLAVSKYMVLNVRQPGYFIKRPGNVFLETWHGTPLKHLVFDQEEVTSASPMYKHQFYVQSRLWDYLISPNDFSTGAFESAFMFEREKIVPCGYPRNDILYTHNNKKDIDKIKRRLGIPLDKTLILYAPTWRDDEYFDKGKYKFSLKLDLNEMKDKLGDKYAVILRTHYYISNSIDTTGLEGFVYNESEYDDISELYLISDILITDYSSVFFDYANLKRPMLFFTYDLEKYRDMLRGFYLDIENDVPGPLLFTTDEVITAIKNIDEINKKYEERYKIFYDRFCHLDDGNASKRICDIVFDL